MFDSVLDRGVAPRRRLATGAVFSVFGHAAVLSLALLVRPPAHVVEEVTKAMPPLVIPMLRPAAAPSPKGPAHAQPAPARTARPRDALVASVAVPKKSVEMVTQPPPDETQDKTPQVGEQIGPQQPAGPLGNGDPQGVVGGTGKCTGRGCDVDGMTAPVLLQRGREPDYTQEALEAHVQGLMTVECVVTLEGRLQQCHALQSLPYMERAVVDALMTRRYTPATLHGHALPVRYVFNVKLVMPK
ncbi:MAG TPA: energy transducer TonB [Myxococcaceae bacterium]|nr:energy transducer TonB [Myxococcaceae bacterium]